MMRGDYTLKPTPNTNPYLEPLQQIFERENAVMRGQHTLKPTPETNPYNQLLQQILDIGWLRFVGSLKFYVSFAKEPYKRDYILQKGRTIVRSLYGKSSTLGGYDS